MKYTPEMQEIVEALATDTVPMDDIPAKFAKLLMMAYDVGYQDALLQVAKEGL